MEEEIKLGDIVQLVRLSNNAIERTATVTPTILLDIKIQEAAAKFNRRGEFEWRKSPSYS